MEIAGNIELENLLAIVACASAVVGLVVGYIIARLEKML